MKKEEVDLCWTDPGFEVDISLYASLLTLVQIFRGDQPLLRACELGKIEMDGPNHLVKSMPAWFPRSKYAMAPADRRSSLSQLKTPSSVHFLD